MEACEFVDRLLEEEQRGLFVSALRSASTATCFSFQFVNCARHEDEQNLIAFQYRGAIFYKTYKVSLQAWSVMQYYGVLDRDLERPQECPEEAG